MHPLNTVVSAAALALMAFTSPLFAQEHVDVLLDVVDGRIVTGGYDIEAGAVVLDSLRVFAAEYGTSPNPLLTAEPGFFALPGTFPPSSQLGFNILQPLLAWNGEGFGPTGGETIRINFATLNATTGGGFVPGFSLFVQPDGGYHRHLNFFIQPPLPPVAAG
jgi:hypothetical protein